MIELRNAMASVSERGLWIAYLAYPRHDIVYASGQGDIRELWRRIRVKRVKPPC